jgi:molybdenum cofactor biosynthesis enzyme MoaA
MLRFPLRLTADLAKAWLTPGVRPIQFVDAADVLHHDASHPVSHEKIRELNSSRSPVVWIGGSEPLDHPGISHLVRAITHTGHFVFLETDGTLLRRRIHEFQPVPRLFLTVRLETRVPNRNSKDLRADAFELAMEGIHAAQLSGFLLCIHTRVQAETKLTEISQWLELAKSLDADGIVISPTNRASNSLSPDAVAVKQKTLEARQLIAGRWWRSFSRLVEPVLTNERNVVRKAGAQTKVSQEEESHADEEGVKVA